MRFSLQVPARPSCACCSSQRWGYLSFRRTNVASRSVISVLSILVSFLFTNGGLFQSASPAVAAELVHWPLNESSGATAADASGSGHAGALINGASWSSGRVGGAVSLDGVDDYLQSSFSTSSSLYTFAAWVYPTTPAAPWPTLFALRNTQDAGKIWVYYYASSGLLALQRTTPGGTTATAIAQTAKIDLNVWNHIAVTYNTATGAVDFYKNGAFVERRTAGATGAGSFSQFRVGVYLTGSHQLEGKVDEVRLYTPALTAAEVQAVYSSAGSSSPPPSSPPPPSGGSPPSSFNFTMSASGSVVLNRGGSATTTVTAALASGSAQSVSYTVSGLPSGVSAVFSPTACIPTCSTTLTLNATSTATVGGATMTVTGRSGSITRSATFTLTVASTASAPTPPAASTPLYYMSPSGSDSNSGSAASPWRTFAYATGRLKPGNTLILRNGAYNAATSGYLSLSCGTNAAQGTASAPITIRAENERQAFIAGDGSVTPVQIRYCSHWKFEGLRVTSADNSHITPYQGDAISVLSANYLTFRRLLVTRSNRYYNTHLLSVTSSNNLVVEENEFYWFHRDAINFNKVNASVVRRNYFNSRRHPDLSGGYGSTNSSTGDDGIQIYPGSNNIVENNISEGQGTGFTTQATGVSDNNRYLGNISLNDQAGLVIKARGASSQQTPTNNVAANFVALNAKNTGIYVRSARGTRCDNCTALNSGHGLIVDEEFGLGDGNFSFFSDNSLAFGNQGTGIKVAYQNSWGVDYADSYGNAINFTPAATDSHITNERSVNPLLGACKVFIPSGSPLKGAGKGGKDIGANVLYRYANGSLTSQPLWNPQSGQFTCGTSVSGVNDVAGASCNNVHLRLNVNANGCSLPAGYGQ